MFRDLLQLVTFAFVDGYVHPIRVYQQWLALLSVVEFVVGRGPAHECLSDEQRCIKYIVCMYVVDTAEGNASRRTSHKMTLLAIRETKNR